MPCTPNIPNPLAKLDELNLNPWSEDKVVRVLRNTAITRDEMVIELMRYMPRREARWLIADGE